MNSLNKIWSNYRYNIKDKVIITNKVISDSINTFWKSEVNITSDQHIIVLFRIKTCDGVILTLGHLQKITSDDLDYYISYVQDILSMKSEDYNEPEPKGIEPLSKLSLHFSKQPVYYDPYIFIFDFNIHRKDMIESIRKDYIVSG
jgi:hypothetical protein